MLHPREAAGTAYGAKKQPTLGESPRQGRYWPSCQGASWVVLEDRDARTFTVPRCRLPADVREGDVVSVNAEEDGEGVRCVR